MRQKFVEIRPYVNWSGLQYIPAHHIAYLEFGDPSNQNVIVCAHGLTRNSHDFNKIAIALSNNFRVIALDYPGRGSSDYFKVKSHYNYLVYSKDTELFLKKLHIQNCIWLGSSMGGIIGMILASKSPHLIKAMIINDIGPFIPAETLVKIGKYASSPPILNDLASAEQYLKLIYSQFGIDAQDDWDYLTKYSVIKNSDGKYVMNYDPAITLSMNGKIKNVDMWNIWNKITCKLLVIHGTKSDILQQSTIEEMQKTKDFDLYVIENVGHAPSLMTKDQIDYIKSWIDQLKY